MAQKRKVRVLFICIGNACRSPMAEAIAKQDAGDVIEATSAGLFPLGYIPELTSKTLLKHGYPHNGLRSKAVALDVWDETDLFVNLSGETIEKAIPYGASIEDWDVDDPYGSDPVLYQRIFEEIRGHVNKLAARLRQPTSVNT